MLVACAQTLALAHVNSYEWKKLLTMKNTHSHRINYRSFIKSSTRYYSYVFSWINSVATFKWSKFKLFCLSHPSYEWMLTLFVGLLRFMNESCAMICFKQHTLIFTYNFNEFIDFWLELFWKNTHEFWMKHLNTDWMKHLNCTVWFIMHLVWLFSQDCFNELKTEFFQCHCVWYHQTYFSWKMAFLIICKEGQICKIKYIAN